MTGPPVLTVRGLRKSYRGRVVADGVDLDVAATAVAARRTAL